MGRPGKQLQGSTPLLELARPALSLRRLSQPVALCLQRQ